MGEKLGGTHLPILIEGQWIQNVNKNDSGEINSCSKFGKGQIVLKRGTNAVCKAQNEVKVQNQIKLNNATLASFTFGKNLPTISLTL